MKRLLSSALLLGLIAAVVPSVAVAQEYDPTASPTWIPQGGAGGNGGGQVWAMAVTDTRIYIGGDFTSLRNPATGAVIARRNLAAIDRATGNPTATWAPAVVEGPSNLDGNSFRIDAAVSSIEVADDGTVFVGGNYSNIGGKARNHIAAVSSAGTVLDTWIPVANGAVRDIALVNSKVYMVGQFDNMNGSLRRGAAAVSPTTAALDPWNALLTGGRAQAIAVSDDASTVFLGGTFTAVGGRAQELLGSVSATTGADTGWDPDAYLCPVGTPDEECRVFDLAVETNRVQVAIGGDGGGRAAAWTQNVGGARLWQNNTDGDVQAVDAYDGVVYFGGHYERVNRNGGTNTARFQFHAADPATGVLDPYQLPPLAKPSAPGLRVIRAGEDALRLGGTTRIVNPAYKNFLTFANPDYVIPGPGEPPVTPPATTTVTVKLKGCPTCKVRLTQKRGSGALWDSKWKTASKGVAVFTVPTSKTVGLTATVDAPWEKKFKKTAEVVMRYKGKAVGAKVSAKAAAKMKKASSCYAGTTAKTLTFTVSVKKAKAGAKVGTRAWVQKTQQFRNPTRKAPKGVLSIKKPTTCT